MMDGDNIDEYLDRASLFAVVLDPEEPGPDEFLIILTTPRFLQHDVRPQSITEAMEFQPVGPFSWVCSR